MFRWAGADRPLVAGNQPFSLCSFQFPPGWFLESFLFQGDLLHPPSPSNCLCNRTDWQSVTHPYSSLTPSSSAAAHRTENTQAKVARGSPV